MGVGTATCKHQSVASFPGAFSQPRNVVVGPLAFVALRGMRDVTPAEIAMFGGFDTGAYKSPALVRAGHTVTVSIDRSARRYARLKYNHRQGPDTAFTDRPHTVRFVACNKQRSQSDVDGKPVTFWSGFFLLTRAPSCVPVTITVAGGAARHRRLSVAGGRCGI